MAKNPSSREITASARTYRKAVNKLSSVLQQNPVHTTKPSQDFEDILSQVPSLQKDLALKWYETGVKRGLTKAIELILANKIYYDANGVLHAPKNIVISVRLKFSGFQKQKHIIRVGVKKDLGF